MQESNARQENCRRFSAPAEQKPNCTQKSQRIRCCGRVTSEQEINNELLASGQGKENCRGRHAANGHGQRKQMGNGQGRQMAKGQGAGRDSQNCQGRQGRGKQMR